MKRLRYYGPLHQCVQLSTVKPHAPALGAVVNLHALAVGDQEGGRGG